MAYVALKRMRLHRALEKGDIQKLTRLLDRGVDPNLEDMWGTSPLEIAILNGNREMTALLIDHGARTDKTGAWGSYLHLAVRRNYIAIADLLIEHDPNLLKTKNHLGKTPLHVAAELGNARLVASFLAKGADPLTETVHRRTALYLAQKMKQQDADEVRYSEVEAILLPLAKKPDLCPPRSKVEWKVLSPEKIAQVAVEQDIGYKITNIFNFKARDCTRIAQNLETKAESIETKGFDDMPDTSSVEEALAELNRQGGKADPCSIASPLKGKRRLG